MWLVVVKPVINLRCSRGMLFQISKFINKWLGRFKNMRACVRLCVLKYAWIGLLWVLAQYRHFHEINDRCVKAVTFSHFPDSYAKNDMTRAE